MASIERFNPFLIASLFFSSCVPGVQTTFTPESSTNEPKSTSTPTDEPTSLAEPAITSTEAFADNACIKTSPEERLLAGEAFIRLYPSWKESYVTPEGAGGDLRVISPDLEYEPGYVGFDTVSEGIGYGMILSSHADDKETFDSLWNYTKSHFNNNGLMSWRIKADNTPYETDSASDADLDIAYALYVANVKWGGYETELNAMLSNILEHDIEEGTFVLKPGDIWGGSEVTSPAYFRPGYYEIFKKVTGDNRWDKVALSSRNIITNILANTSAQETGLLPDWSKADGTPINAMGKDFSWVATRFPWAQTMAVVQHCGNPGEVDNHAIELINLTNNFFENIGSNNIVAGYELDGTPLVSYHELTFLSVLAAAATLSDNAQYRKDLLNDIIYHGDDNYFGDSLRMLSLLLISNKIAH